jgi:hypothetical protein
VQKKSKTATRKARNNGLSGAEALVSVSRLPVIDKNPYVNAHFRKFEVAINSKIMASLTELCSICFTNPPKYTCPRCGCQTCRVTCVKIHKKRAACSGVRNPASYLKSSELATPASIDRDYNFITKVQRDIEKAEDDVADRGITFAAPRSSRNPHGSKSKLEIEYETCGVTIIKAPVGLTRSKQNKTHWDKRHNCVMWTVEWVLQNDQRVLANVQGGRTVIDAFTNGVGKKGLQKKRKLEDTYQEESEWAPKQKGLRQEPVAQNSATEEPVEEQPDTKLEDPAVNKQSEQVSPPQPEDTNQASTTTTDPTEPLTPSQIHFYLHRPCTSSKWTVLIPISPTPTISGLLRDRTILEFPTIHARHEAEDELKPPLITEREYDEKYGVDVVPSLSAVGFGQEDESGAARDAIPDHVDERKILEVLKRDVVG